MTPADWAALEALRRFVGAYHDSTLDLARWMDLPRTDGTALGEIVWAEREHTPLSPARLSERLGLTSGATNAVVNRLEGLGLVCRSRESDDRRIVTLRATPTAQRRLEPFLEQARDRLPRVLAAYTPEEAELLARFLTDLVTALPSIDDASTSRSSRS
ncbi:MarR family transcriptional regulator [Phycicoccus sp. CSK15P-2]|uniref:MarR family winged helix-turn-helix transcriptional regulator n=1 Tax=Phycicoccus sp. CSK15P-2 TaxID=2807627 RepID=UPI0019508CDF|nr:MarR family transcriptional regulator [Phycicoccus sp. CSK15P-2]MBM6405775.1 MarR family transcriptional regulator [Phycicoccus sp. CSK15P-2]